MNQHHASDKDRILGNDNKENTDFFLSRRIDSQYISRTTQSVLYCIALYTHLAYV